MRQVVTLVVLAALMACGPTPAPQPPTPPKWDLSIHVTDQETNKPVPKAVTSVHTTDPTKRIVIVAGEDGVAYYAGLPQAGYSACARAEKYQQGGETCNGVNLTTSQATGIALKPDAPPPPPARQGQITNNKFIWQDAGGPFLVRSTSFFWALWGELFDTERTDQNWATAAGHDYVRIFAQVGGDSWSDRAVGPATPGWKDAITRVTDKAYDKYGMRVQWTLFAWAKGLSASERSAAVQTFLSAIDGRHHKVAAVEISNEGWSNGPDFEETRKLAADVKARFPGFVALTAPNGDSCDIQRELYGGSKATLITLHFSREFAADGPWRSVRQPWRESDFDCDGLPTAYSSNEPMGPNSSVNEDADPLRLTLTAIVSWLTGVANYTYHTDAGIRGGGHADLERGRVANFWQVENWTATTGAIKLWAEKLNPALPNWKKTNGHWDDCPMKLVDPEQLMRQYCAQSGPTFVCAALDQKETVHVKPLKTSKVTIHHPVTGAVLFDGVVNGGQDFAYPSTPSGLVILGQQQ